MAVNFNDVVKQGYGKIKSRTLGTWTKKWMILRKPSSSGPRRLELYDDEKRAKSRKDCKTTDLTYLVHVARLPSNIKGHGVKLLFKEDTSRMLAFDTENTADEWFTSLEKECLLPSSKSEVDPLHANPQDDLDATLNVFLCPNQKTNLFGECLLQVTSESIRLLDVHDAHQLLLAWSLGTIRRYTRDPSKFTIETGRSSSTGEALFVFNTIHGEEIYKRVHGATMAIAAAQKTMKVLTEPLQPLNREVISNIGRTNSAPLFQSESPSRPTFQHSQSVPGGSSPHGVVNRAPMPLPRIKDEVPLAPPPPCQVPANSDDQHPPDPEHQQPVTDGGYLKQVDRGKGPEADDIDEDSRKYENGVTIRSLCGNKTNKVISKPGSSKTSPITGNEDEELEYIYEEKQLSHNFRKFLHTRKGDKNTTE